MAVATRPTPTGTRRCCAPSSARSRVCASFWRGVGVLELRQPAAVPRRHGPRARAASSTTERRVDRRRARLPRLRHARPAGGRRACRPRPATRCGRSSAGSSGRDLPRHGRVAVPPGRRVRRSCGLDRGPRGARPRSPFLVVAALLGGVGSPWARARRAGRRADRAGRSRRRSPRSPPRRRPTCRSRWSCGSASCPLFLFSGTFFPIDQLPDGVQSLAWLSPLWHGVELCRASRPVTWTRCRC